MNQFTLSSFQMFMEQVANLRINSIFRGEAGLYPDIEDDPDPFCLNKIVLYYPTRHHSRLVAQDGVFIVHPPPFGAVHALPRTRYEIPASLKKEFLLSLDKLGFKEDRLFPGLDSLASWIGKIKGWP